MPFGNLRRQDIRWYRIKLHEKKTVFRKKTVFLHRRKNRRNFAFRHVFQDIQHIHQHRNPHNCRKHHGYGIPYGAVSERRDKRAAEVVDAVEDHAEPDTLCFQQNDRAHPADEEGIPRLKQDSGGGHARKQVHQMNGGEHGGGEDGWQESGVFAEGLQDVREEESAERQFLEQSDGSGLQDEKEYVGDARINGGRTGEQPKEGEIVDRDGCGGEETDESAAFFRHAENTTAVFSDEQEKQRTAGGTCEDGTDHFVPERVVCECRPCDFEYHQNGCGEEQEGGHAVRTFHYVPSGFG